MTLDRSGPSGQIMMDSTFRPDPNWLKDYLLTITALIATAADDILCIVVVVVFSYHYLFFRETKN